MFSFKTQTGSSRSKTVKLLSCRLQEVVTSTLSVLNFLRVLLALKQYSEEKRSLKGTMKSDGNVLESHVEDPGRESTTLTVSAVGESSSAIKIQNV